MVTAYECDQSSHGVLYQFSFYLFGYKWKGEWLKNGGIILFCIYFHEHTRFAHFSAAVLASLFFPSPQPNLGWAESCWAFQKKLGSSSLSRGDLPLATFPSDSRKILGRISGFFWTWYPFALPVWMSSQDEKLVHLPHLLLLLNRFSEVPRDPVAC